jgi:hypothetical protein
VLVGELRGDSDAPPGFHSRILDALPNGTYYGGQYSFYISHSAA